MEREKDPIRTPDFQLISYVTLGNSASLAEPPRPPVHDSSHEATHGQEADLSQRHTLGAWQSDVTEPVLRQQ